MYAAWWLLFVGAQTYVLFTLGLTRIQILADVLLFTFIVVLSSLAAGFVFRYYQPGTGGWMYRVLFGLIITTAGCFVYYLASTWWHGTDLNYLYVLRRSLPIRFLFVLVLIAFHIVLMWVISAAEETAEISRRRNEVEKLARDAELSSLRQQLNPHFIFNSLNSINALAGTDPAGVRHMIQLLSDFLRGTIKSSESAVSLNEEIAHLRLYLDIEKVRFGHRLDVQIIAGEECAGKMLPSLILQPVIENAIKFGLYGTTGEVPITVTAHCKENILSIMVTNPFEKEHNRSAGTGFGLKGVRRRLELLYGRADLLQTASQEGVFKTTVQIPQ